MDIRADNGSSFHLNVLGYQYPEIDNEEWDSNWLRMHMAVSVPQGSWSVADPFLLTYEVKRLADWLDAVTNDTEAENEIGFTEPNLWFEVIDAMGRGKYLRAHFAIECLPPWAASNEHGTEDIFAEFSLSSIDLHTAADSLRYQLSVYPQRAAR